MPFMARLPGIESSPDGPLQLHEGCSGRGGVDDSSQPANLRLFCPTESQGLDFEVVCVVVWDMFGGGACA